MANTSCTFDRRLFLRCLAILATSVTTAGLCGCDRAESYTPPHPMPSNKMPPKPGAEAKKARG
jgi:hypothetical protein